MEDFVEDYTLNISRGGMMVCTDHALQVGDTLEMALSFPRLLAPIAVRGVVRWVRQDGGTGERTAGVEFQHVDELARVSFERLMDRVIAGDQAMVASATINVLVADDNPFVAELISQGLHGHGKRCQSRVSFDTRHAADGQEAVRQLEERRYDLLVVDLSLAVIDGEALIKQLRADRRWDHLAIVAVGGRAEDRRSDVLGAGADYYLTKPLRLVDVLEAMSRLIVLDG